jgi:integrase
MSELEQTDSGLVVVRPGETGPVAYTDLDYSITTETAEALLEATPANTRLAYGRAWSNFETWCERTGRVALPATPHTLAEYVRTLTAIDLAPATIDQAIGTIRSRHKKAGFRDQPDTDETLKLVRKYRRDWADRGYRVRKRTPILLPALRAMVQTCDESPLGVRDRAILLLGFNMMARRSELANLDLADITYVGDEGLEAHVKYSKTDQDAAGAAVAVPYGQHVETCAVRAVRAWTDLLAERGFRTGALFRPVDRHGRIGDEAGAAGNPRPRLTPQAINDEIIPRRARLAQLPDARDYGGHSLRSGAATTAYAAGAPVSGIASHGRWSPKSPVVLGYIRKVDNWSNNPMKGTGL